MADKWHAECIPCGWLTLHDDENLAIAAAVKHVNENHPDILPEVRGARKIGHVQMRTVDTAPSEDDQLLEKLSSGPGPTAGELAGTSAAAPGQPTKTGDATLTATPGIP